MSARVRSLLLALLLVTCAGALYFRSLLATFLFDDVPAIVGNARERDPSEHADLGLALARMGRWSEAEAELERALAGDAANGTARKTLARVLVHRGEALVMEGKLADAVPHFQRAVQLDPQFSAAQQDLIATLARIQILSREPTAASPARR